MKTFSFYVIELKHNFSYLITHYSKDHVAVTIPQRTVTNRLDYASYKLLTPQTKVIQVWSNETTQVVYTKCSQGTVTSNTYFIKCLFAI